MNSTQDCGRHIEDLSDYLDNGTSTDAEHIENCPLCQLRLSGLRSLSAAVRELMVDDEEAAAADDAGWLDGLLANLDLETRAGRSIPLGSDGLDQLSETEGAVVALIRRVGDAMGGVLIGRCRLEGDIGTVGSPVDVRVNVSARYPHPLPALADELRLAIHTELLRQTELNVVAVHVAFTDMRPPLDQEPAGGQP